MKHPWQDHLVFERFLFFFVNVCLLVCVTEERRVIIVSAYKYREYINSVTQTGRQTFTKKPLIAAP